MISRTLFGLLLSAFTTSLLPAQGQDALVEKAPWLYLEASPFLIDQQLRSGEEYTTQGFSYGYDTRLIANRQLGGRLAIQVGVGIGTWKFEQNSRYAQWWQERNFPQVIIDEPWFSRTTVDQTYVELPLSARVILLDLKKGALYLRGGTSWKLPFIQSVGSYRVSERGGEPALMPDEELARKSTHLVTGNLGYMIKEGSGYRWYVELHYGGSTGTAFDQEESGGVVRSTAYLRSAAVRQLGIVGGFGF